MATSGTTIGGQPVSDELWRRIGVSLRLLVIGSVVGTVIGVVVGAWGAIRQYHLSDRVITRPVAVGDQHASVRDRQPSDPRGVAGQLGARACSCSSTPARHHRTRSVEPGTSSSIALQHLVLPTFTLALGRHRRLQPVSAQRDARRARPGFHSHRRAPRTDPTPRICSNTDLRTALIPMATLFAYGVAGLFTGAVFTEKIFGWHGVGEWFVQGVAHAGHEHRHGDHPVFRRDDPVGRAAVRRHLRRARSEGAGAMSGTRSPPDDRRPPAKSGVDVSTRSRRGAAHRAAPIPAQQARGGARSILLGGAVHRLLRAAAVAAVQLQRSGLSTHCSSRPASTIGSAPTRSVRTCWPKPCAACRNPMLIGVCVAFISTIIAATVGTIAGYFGGWRDRTLMWIVDLLLVVPSFLPDRDRRTAHQG